MGEKKRLVVGISGASGASLALNLLQTMQTIPDWEVDLVVSGGAERTLRHELGLGSADLADMVDNLHPLDDIGASIASGTYRTEGMVVIPCSMKTLAGVAHGYSDNLLLRAADVTMKERRKLVLVARETPLSLIHLQNMTTMASFGAVILPPMLTYYNKPETLRDMNDHIVGKVLNEFGVEHRRFRRWRGMDDDEGSQRLREGA